MVRGPNCDYVIGNLDEQIRLPAWCYRLGAPGLRGAIDSWFTGDYPFRSLCSLLPTNLPLFSGLLQLPIPLGMDLPLTPGEHAPGCE